MKENRNMTTIKTPKKLIEVALPLDDINIASAREKSIRHGHPSTLHLWFARRPLAAARAILFAQMVNDPGYERHLGRGVNKEKAKLERERLFSIIRDLVKWENTNNEDVLNRARDEINRSWRETCELNAGKPGFDPERLPVFHDPFAGGGSLPLEAQRLGFETYATDLNPVPVVLNKAMIEIPPRFKDRAPVGPKEYAAKQSRIEEIWSGAQGLSEDLRRYGNWVLQQATERLAQHYPKIKLPHRLGGGKATVLTWLWCRTVASPNPAAGGVHVPLAKSFQIASREGREFWIEPKVSEDRLSYEFVLKEDGPPAYPSTVGGRGGICVLTDSPITLNYIRAEGVAGRMGQRLMAAVVETSNGKAFVAASEIEEPDFSGMEQTAPDAEILHWAGCTNVVVYGMKTFPSLFNLRQQLALSTFSSLVVEARELVKRDAVAAGFPDDGVTLRDGGAGATAYAEAISVYLACAIGRAADYWNTLTSWESGGEFVAHAFTKHALPIVWDYGEINPLTDGGGSWSSALGWIARVIDLLPANAPGHVFQLDAAKGTIPSEVQTVVSTDPPYYDNVPYSNLSDFFYIWLRPCLRDVFPDVFATRQTPKEDELVASHSLYEDIGDAMKHFTDGMTLALRQIHAKSNDSVPVTIYYAFKQSDTGASGTASSGWESFLESVIKAEFVITGTWPVRTERSSRGRAIGSNALASSIVLVCRKRDKNAEAISRRDFQRELKDHLRDALEEMIGGVEGVSPVAPVDLAQAVIGPGMAVFSKYSSVLEADGSPMTVHTALTLINKMLTDGADDFDSDTHFCLAWFDEQGWADGDFGQADVLARAKGTSVQAVAAAGVVRSGGGNVRLFKPAEYAADWRPENDNNTPVWEALHQMIRALQSSGETAAGELLAGMPARADQIRNLAYRLYTLCERKKWADEARAYNELVTAWSAIEQAAGEFGVVNTQRELDI
ncbi:putative DNA methylase [Paraburkholderia caballeronis]|uniref:Putative DNA methylase n=2 Tax=Paraburkholderia caballeronis TaxID=416943 RepID=A0A1H7VEU5_9BURK|nr:putative DNA methylase [Paraburkholderia caballeronis]PXW94610.1 putative DNA methylase [Paraburkholderia caballeronis]RAJ89999.1 putative DNA methylase [Paraburkholderia caballeronis]SEM07766.1 putative DNA methylase [Paraburkholderia caballeronis]